MTVTSIWDTLTRIVIALLFVAGLLGVFFWYLPLIQQNQRMRKFNLELERQVQEEERLGRSQKTVLEACRNNGRAIERLARERLSYARSNETVFVFEPASGVAR